MSKKPYRGKRLDNGEWVKGYYVRLSDGNKGRDSHRIYSGYADIDCGDYYPSWYKVDPATVGRYSEFEDNNGTEIFEGDKIEIRGFRRVDNKLWSAIGIVVFEYGEWAVSYCGGGEEPLLSALTKWDCKVAGNVHDSPPEEREMPIGRGE